MALYEYDYYYYYYYNSQPGPSRHLGMTSTLQYSQGKYSHRCCHLPNKVEHIDLTPRTPHTYNGMCPSKKIAHSQREIRAPVEYTVLWSQPNPYRNQTAPDRFIRFCRTHQQTDRHTEHETSVEIPHFTACAAMRPENGNFTVFTPVILEISKA